MIWKILVTTLAIGILGCNTETKEQRQERKAFVAKVGRNPSPADLHIVAELDLPMLARSLLNQGANANAKNNDGLTPLHYATGQNASATAEILINQGANVNDKNNDGLTPLHYATGQNASATAEILINRGANVNDKNNDGVDAAALCDGTECFGDSRDLDQSGS